MPVRFLCCLLLIGLGLGSNASAADVPAPQLIAGKPAAVEVMTPKAEAGAVVVRRDQWPWNVPIVGDDWGIGSKAREKFEQSAPRYRWPAPKQAALQPTLTAPRLPDAGANPTPAASITANDVMAGWQPMPTAPAAASATAPAPLPEQAQLQLVSAPRLPPVQAFNPSTGACQPQRISWVRQCAEVGYPANFAGQITGETRIECPAGQLNDVWLTNSCAPPGMAATDVLAPAAEPTPSAPNTDAFEMAEAALANPTASSVTPAQSANTGSRENILRVGAAAPNTVASSDDNWTNKTINGQCGAAHTLAFSAAPGENLCATGLPTAVQADGKAGWRWSCQGANGGQPANCQADNIAQSASTVPAPAAPATIPATAGAQPIDGQCGPAHQTGAINAPTSGFCAAGIASDVNGRGPWYWACAGINGGRPSSCMTLVRQDAACGPAHGSALSATPASGLCARGEPANLSGAGPWNWTCAGVGGGASASCVANLTQDAACGPNSGVGTLVAPTNGLCRDGTATTVTGSGPWRWQCQGGAGGRTANCEAPLRADASCGLTHGRPQTARPSTNLCAAGQASAVMGEGPWSWVCRGTGGGQDVSCLAAKVAAQPPMAQFAPTTNRSETLLDATAAMADILPAPVPPSTETEELVLGSEPVRESGKFYFRAVLPANPAPQPILVNAEPVLAACGEPNGKTMSVLPPAADLCKSGTADQIKGEGPWTWQCNGGVGGTSVMCLARSERPAAKLAEGAEHERPVAAPVTPIEQEVVAAVAAPASAPAVMSTAVANVTSDTPPTKTEPDLLPAVTAPVTAEAPPAAVLAVAPPPVVAPPAAAPPAMPPASKPVVSPLPPTAAKSQKQLSARELNQRMLARLAAIEPPAAAQAEPSAMPVVPLAAVAPPAPPPAPAPPAPPVAAETTRDLNRQQLQQLLQRAPDSQPVTTRSSDVGDAAPTNSPSTRFLVPPAGQSAAPSTAATTPAGVAHINVSASQSPSVPVAGATKAKANGQCGRAAGVVAATLPTIELCQTGAASRVNGTGPWYWTCGGQNGGEAMACTAPRLQENTMLNEPAPASPPVTTALPLVTPPAVNAVPANVSAATVPVLPPPALVADGACGWANGRPTEAAPAADLCLQGTATAVTGAGPWQWTCQGQGGGNNVSCAAMPLRAGSPAPAMETTGASTSLVTPQLSATNRDEADVLAIARQNLAAAAAANPPAVPMAPAAAPVTITPPQLSPLPAPTTNVIAPGVTNYQPAAPIRAVPQGLETPNKNANIVSNPPEIPAWWRTIEFEYGSTAVPADEKTEIVDLLNIIKQSSPNAFIQIVAYANQQGNSTREARRLSLSRGLAVRNLLIELGFNSNQIEVRAMGANVPSGKPDRADLVIR